MRFRWPLDGLPQLGCHLAASRQVGGRWAFRVRQICRSLSSHANIAIGTSGNSIKAITFAALTIFLSTTALSQDLGSYNLNGQQKEFVRPSARRFSNSLLIDMYGTQEMNNFVPAMHIDSASRVLFTCDAKQYAFIAIKTFIGPSGGQLVKNGDTEFLSEDAHQILNISFNPIRTESTSAEFISMIRNLCRSAEIVKEEIELAVAASNKTNYTLVPSTLRRVKNTREAWIKVYKTRAEDVTYTNEKNVLLQRF